MAQFSPFIEPPPANPRGVLGTGAAFEWLVPVLASQRTTALALVVAIALALLAPLGPLTANRFHRDEAIYSSWGLNIASGRDLLVSDSPVDKPPLFLYTQALGFLLFGPTEVAARLPSLVASVVSVGLLYALGRSLYGRGVGLLAAFLLAASPFTILFAPTAFTDPMMVTWVLAGCLAAVHGYWGWTGILLGLAAITKQQGAFFVLLALGLGLISNGEHLHRAHPCLTTPASQAAPGPQVPANCKSQIVSLVVAFLAVSCLAIGWDFARARRPGFLAQSLISYGGLSLSLTAVWDHLLGFWGLLRYGTGSPVLNSVLLVGLPLLLVVDILLLLDPSNALFGRLGRSGSQSQAKSDLVLLVFIALFLVGHSLLAFVVWDRYLLGLIPLLVLLLARVLTFPQRLLRESPLSGFLCLLFALFMLFFTLPPIQDAAASRIPIGGDHGAYQGIEQVVNYLQAIPADTTLYHRWLGWHWRFYLWGSPYDFRAWTSPADLAAQARSAATRPAGTGAPQVQPGAGHYIVFPSWRSSTEARLALADAGLAMREVQRAFRDDGSVSFIVYRIEEAQ